MECHENESYNKVRNAGERLAELEKEEEEEEEEKEDEMRRKVGRRSKRRESNGRGRKERAKTA